MPAHHALGEFDATAVMRLDELHADQVRPRVGPSSRVERLTRGRHAMERESVHRRARAEPLPGTELATDEKQLPARWSVDPLALNTVGGWGSRASKWRSSPRRQASSIPPTLRSSDILEHQVRPRLASGSPRGRPTGPDRYHLDHVITMTLVPETTTRLAPAPVQCTTLSRLIDDSEHSRARGHPTRREPVRLELHNHAFGLPCPQRAPTASSTMPRPMSTLLELGCPAASTRPEPKVPRASPAMSLCVLMGVRELGHGRVGPPLVTAVGEAAPDGPG